MASKIIYNGSDNYIRALKGDKLLWEKDKEYRIMVRTDREGVEFMGNILLPNVDNYVYVSGNQIPCPDGITEMYLNDFPEVDGFHAGGNGTLTKFIAPNTKFINCVENIFMDCFNLKEVSDLNTSDLVNAEYMFHQCWELETVGKLNFSNVELTEGVFESSGPTNLGGFTGLHTSIEIYAGSLTKQSVLNIFNEAATIDNGSTISLRSFNDDLLTEDELAIITNKGWTVRFPYN